MVVCLVMVMFKVLCKGKYFKVDWGFLFFFGLSEFRVDIDFFWLYVLYFEVKLCY